VRPITIATSRIAQYREKPLRCKSLYTHAPLRMLGNPLHLQTAQTIPALEGCGVKPRWIEAAPPVDARIQ
jgi:hypothetical protein